MEYEKPYCYHPFINLTIESGGHIRPCCASPVSFGNITEVGDIRVFWHTSEEMSKIRSQMSMGIVPSGKICRACTRSENSGLLSKRVRYAAKTEPRPYEFKLNTCIEDPAITDMDISFSRTCNLQCATCNSQYSSKWFSDDRKRMNLKLISHEDIGKYIGENPLMSDSQIDQLLDISYRSRSIVVKGGEPFLDSGFKKFVTQMEYKGIKSFSCVTNGTIYDEEILSEIVKFKSYHISISVDGIPEVHKWIRRSDDEMFQNLHKNAEYLKKIETNCVISAFNIFTMDKYLESLCENKRYRISNASFHSIAKRVYETPLIFDKKYLDLMYETLNRCRELILNNPELSSMTSVTFFEKAMNYVRSNEYHDYHNEASTKKFLQNYDEILVPSRGYCLSEVEPIFGDALADLRKRCA